MWPTVAGLDGDAMAECLLALGSNLGDRAGWLQRALQWLRQHSDWEVEAASEFHETTAIGGPPGQSAYLNAAARCRTALEPQAALAQLLACERALGRTRHDHWGPRTIDLDLLLYDDHICRTPLLQLPHPRLAVRRFVLVPAVQVAAHMRHPEIGWTLEQLLDFLDHAEAYTALSGMAGIRRELASSAAAACGVEWLADPAPPIDLGGAEDLSGQPAARQLEFLELRCRLLAEAQQRLRHGRTGEILSDFCIEESWICALQSLDAAAWDGFRRVWETWEHALPKPKLLVWIEPVAGSHATAAARRTRELVETLRQRALRPGRGPFLQLSADQPEAARAELQAALISMRA